MRLFFCKTVKLYKTAFKLEHGFEGRLDLCF